MNYVLSDILWALAVMLLLGACITVVKKLDRKKNFDPEISRKLVHIVMGIAVLPFPWLFHHKLTVIVTGFIAFAALLALRLLKDLKNGMGSVLYKVNRANSVGELVFPLAVVVTFVIAPTPVFYVIPILVLTFSDSMAAIVGIEYAKKQLADQREDPKSLEGAVTFFFTSFLFVVSPLLLMSDLEKRDILFVSLIIAAIATLMELVSAMGLDNFLVPFTIAVFLSRLSQLSTQNLINSLLVLLFFAGLGIFFIRYKNITRLGIVEAVLVMFLSTLMGSYFWVIAPMILFLSYSFLPNLLPQEKAFPLNNHLIESNILPGVLIIVVGALLNNKSLLFWSYSTYYASLTAGNYYLRVHYYHPAWQKASKFFGPIRGILFILVPSILLYNIAYGSLPLIYMITSTAAAVIAFLPCMVALKRREYTDVSLRLSWLNSATSTLLVCLQVIFLLVTGAGK